jgi:hypothetical protein
MHEDLSLRRRALIKIYVRYLQADRDWLAACRAAVAWLPTAPPAKLALIGDPGSRVRRLYEDREKARLRLLVARDKLQVARHRHAERRASHVVLLLTRGAPG